MLPKVSKGFRAIFVVVMCWRFGWCSRASSFG